MSKPIECYVVVDKNRKAVSVRLKEYEAQAVVELRDYRDKRFAPHEIIQMVEKG